MRVCVAAIWLALWLGLVCDGRLKCCQLRARVYSGDTEVREQRNEHPSVQLFASPVLAAQLHGRLHLVAAVRRRKRSVGYNCWC